VTAAISLRGLRKAYRVYGHPRDMMIEALSGRQRHHDFVALDDVSFDVFPGEVVGIMGRNGAGKSTLLRIIAGTLDATGGTVETRGRIAAILELGTGFHPDYSGRENVYLGGLCLGLSRAEIDRRFDEIVAFSELEAFIDQPFRTYSTGMQARLTFSVATCVDPDILIIDEALSVGDARFQLKSFDRIRAFKRRGKSILIVSHSINQIVAICDRAILLERGKILADSDPNKVGQIYHELLFAPAQPATPPMKSKAAEMPETQSMVEAVSAWKAAEPPIGTAGARVEGPAAPSERRQKNPADKWLDEQARDRRHDYGDGRATITDVFFEDEARRRTSYLEPGKDYRIIIDITANAPLSSVCVGFIIRSAWGLDLYGTDTRHVPCPGLPSSMAPGDRLRVTIITPLNLAPSTYFLSAGVAALDETKYHMKFDCCEFHVALDRTTMFTSSLVDIRPKLSAAIMQSAS
jgi:lipopolysaccharide transport system ATP-binding protein